VPVLARAVEQSGIATVLVTMMPELGERFLLPRIVGVEFPFGHPFGMAHDRKMQRAAAETALTLYARQDLPTRTDVPIQWPVEWKTAYRSWQPKEPAPIIRYLKDQVLLKHKQGQG